MTRWYHTYLIPASLPFFSFLPHLILECFQLEETISQNLKIRGGVLQIYSTSSCQKRYLSLSSDVFIELPHVVPLFHFLCMLDPQPFVSVLPWHSQAVLSAPVLFKYTTLYCYTCNSYSTKILTKLINFLKKICDLLFTPDIGFFTQLEQK